MISEPYIGCFGGWRRVSEDHQHQRRGEGSSLAVIFTKEEKGEFTGASVSKMMEILDSPIVFKILNLLSVPWVSSNQGLKTS